MTQYGYASVLFILNYCVTNNKLWIYLYNYLNKQQVHFAYVLKLQSVIIIYFLKGLLDPQVKKEIEASLENLVHQAFQV